MKKVIAVIFGGKSTEHDISILSALQVMEALDSNKYEILPVYIDKLGTWYFGKMLKNLNTFKQFNPKNFKQVVITPISKFLYIKKLNVLKQFKKIDCVVPVLHGINGEDGTLQGLLELANLPYTSCGVLSSSIGIDKLAQKQFYEALNIPVIPYFSLTKIEYDNLNGDLKLEDFLYPVVVKPNRLGSSIGIKLCKNKKQLEQALNLAFMFDDKVVIEKAITNLKEVNISVVGYRQNLILSETEQPIKKHEILSFVDKYYGKNTKSKGFSDKKSTIYIKNQEKFNFSGAKQSSSKTKGMQNLDRIVPAKLDKKTLFLVEEYAKKIFTNLNCKGVVRFDYIYDTKQKKLYINEINTIPGSLAFYLWEYKGISFTQVLDKIIDFAIEENKNKNMKKLTFESNVI